MNLSHFLFQIQKSRYYGDINTPNIILIFCLFTLVPAPKRKNSSIMFHPCYYFWQCVTICAFTLIYCTSKKTNIILINREYTRNHVSKFIFFIKNQEFENHYPIKHRHKIHIHSLTEIRNIICYTALIWAKSRDTLRFNEKLSSRVSTSLFSTGLYAWTRFWIITWRKFCRSNTLHTPVLSITLDSFFSKHIFYIYDSDFLFSVKKGYAITHQNTYKNTHIYTLNFFLPHTYFIRYSNTDLTVFVVCLFCALYNLSKDLIQTTI